MTIIDRYVLRQFVQVFIICWVSLTGVYVVFHAFSNLDHFMKFSEKDGNLAQLMGGFYFFRSLDFFDQTSAILTLVAAMFTATWIQRHNELTALMSAGISPRRVVKPIIFAAVAVSLVSAVSREVVIPQFRTQLAQDPRDLAGDKAKRLDPLMDETGIVMDGDETLANEQRIVAPRFSLPVSLDPEGRTIAGANGYFRPADRDHPAGYLIREISEPLELSSEPAMKQGDQIVVFTPESSPGWLKPDECFVASEVPFELLANRESFGEHSSVPQMIRELRQMSSRPQGHVLVAIHARIVQPLLDVSLLFLGLPLVLTRRNRNIFMAIGQCVVLVGGFMLVMMACHYFATIWGQHHALAAWLPAMIFIPAAVAMYERVDI